MTDKIGYEALTQSAMRGVVRHVLRTVQKNGAPAGDHHFYITFRTRAPGVNIADHLVERFPQDMTIVVQHQYWDLEVYDGHFEIILKFAGVPQHLHIPFAAITRFVDPSVNFGLTFEAANADPDNTIIDSTGDRTDAPASSEDTSLAPTPDTANTANTVVNLDTFRRNK